MEETVTDGQAHSLIEIEVLVPGAALLRSGASRADLPAETNKLSLSEDGVSISVHPLEFKSAAVELSDAVLWVTLIIAGGFFGSLGGKILDKVAENLSKVLNRVRKQTRVNRLGIEWDIRLSDEKDIIILVHSDGNVREVLPFLREDILAAAIGREAPLDEVALVVLHFRHSPPRLEIEMIVPKASKDSTPPASEGD